MLAELAIYEPHSFKALVEQVQFMRGAPATPSSAGQRLRKDLARRISIGSLAGSSNSSGDNNSSSSSSSSSSLGVS
jgi:hypothetical protein